MPLVKYICKCGHTRNKFSRPGKVKEVIECDKCGGEMVQEYGSPTSFKTQIIDNGIMQKEVELMDAIEERMIEKRSKK